MKLLKMFDNNYMTIYAFVLPSILGASVPTYSVIKGEPSLLLIDGKETFQSIRQTCAQLNGSLISPMNFTKTISKNISSLWTGTYTTESDWIAYLGCFPVRFDPNINTLHNVSSLEDNSPGKCQKYCSCYQFIALQGKWCFCLNIYSGRSNLGNCTRPCNGSTQHKCGGETHASVYTTMRFQRDDSQDDEDCISMQCLNNTIDLRSNECNASKPYKCAADHRLMSQRVRWITGADMCSNQSSVLETYINNTRPACKDYPLKETWTGLFREHIELHVEELNFQPKLSCSVFLVNSSEEIKDRSCSEQHHFLCKVTRQTSQNVHQTGQSQVRNVKNGLPCNHSIYNAILFSENKTKGKECSTEKLTSTDYVDFKSRVQTQASDISTQEIPYNKTFTTEDTLSSKVIPETSDGHVNIFSTRNKGPANLHTDTKFANYTPATTTAVKMTDTCLNCDDKTKKSDAFNTGLIAGIVSAVIVLLAAVAIIALWRRKKRQETHRRKEDANSKTIINNSYDQRMVPINQKENNQNTKDSRQEYSYAYMQSQNSDGNTSADLLSKSGRKENRATDDLSVYDHLNSKPNYKTNISNIYDTSKTHDDESYDSFTTTRNNVPLDDIYSHTCTKVNIDDREYDHLHMKTLSRDDTDVYGHI